MTRHIVAMVSLLVLLMSSTTSGADEGSHPNQMLGYLKPGMLVGIQTTEGTTSVLLDVYTDDDFKIAKDLAALGRTSVRADQFAQDHPIVRKQFDAFLEELAEKSPESKSESVMIFPLIRTSFGSITAVGEDYVLVNRDGDTKRRLLISRSSISRIDLDAQPVRFFNSLIRSRGRRERQ